MSIFYHRSDCKGSMYPSGFQPAVMKNRAGFYVGYMCEECQVHNRESGYYDDEPAAWSDYNLLVQGLPITNPREAETADEMLIRRLKEAGLDPKPDAANDPIPGKPAKILITPDGAVDIQLEDPLGAKLHVRFHITPWGLLGTTSSGFGSVVTDEGFLVIMPDSDHTAESQNGLVESIRELEESMGEVEQDTSIIDAESTL